MRLLIEVEGVAQIARRPCSAAEGVLVHELSLVVPTIGFLETSLELRLSPQRTRVVGLRGELTGERIVGVDLPLNRRAGGTTVPILRLTPQQRVVFVARAIEPHFAGKLVGARRDGVLPRQRVVPRETARLAVAIHHIAIEECLARVEVFIAGESSVVAVTAVRGEGVGNDILVTELVVDVPSEIVAAIDGGAIDVLILVVLRSAGRREPQTIVQASDRAIVGIEPVRAEPREESALIAKTSTAIEAAGCGEAGVQARAQAEVGVSLENDIDDAGHSIRIVLGGRIGYDFHALDDVRGNLFEIRSELGAFDRRGATVDLDHDVLITAQADLAILVDFDRRGGRQNIAGVGGSRCDVLSA